MCRARRSHTSSSCSLNHAERLHELYTDILTLRQQALDKDGKVCDPQLFAKSIRLRNQLLKDELDMVDGTHAADAVDQFLRFNPGRDKEGVARSYESDCPGAL